MLRIHWMKPPDLRRCPDATPIGWSPSTYSAPASQFGSVWIGSVISVDLDWPKIDVVCYIDSIQLRQGQRVGREDERIGIREIGKVSFFAWHTNSKYFKKHGGILLLIAIS